MDKIQLIGLAAAACTTFSLLPQIIKILRTKDTSGISLVMYSMFTSGILLWLIYGILRNDIPVIAANAVTVIFAILILIYTFRNKRSR